MPGDAALDLLSVRLRTREGGEGSRFAKRPSLKSNRENLCGIFDRLARSPHWKIAVCARNCNDKWLRDIIASAEEHASLT